MVTEFHADPPNDPLVVVYHVETHTLRDYQPERGLGDFMLPAGSYVFTDDHALNVHQLVQHRFARAFRQIDLGDMPF